MNRNITYIKELSLNYTIETTPKVYEKISNSVFTNRFLSVVEYIFTCILIAFIV